MPLRVGQKLLILWSFYLTLQLAEGNELRKARMKVYCNEYVPYGKPTPIVISMKLFPVKTTITVHLSTPSYLLALFEVGSESEEVPSKWRRTSSIRNELSALGIRKRRDKWMYEKGFWTNLTGIFWTASDKFLTLLGRSESHPQRLQVKEVVRIEVDLPAQCAPQISLPECSLPESPRKTVITRGFQVRAIFLEKCNLSIGGVYNWSLSDAAGLTQFASYSTERPLLKVPPYSWRFPASYELLRDFYLLQVEGWSEGSHYAARCYVKVAMGQVEAVISGGRHRRSGYREPLWMNGSLSYDFSKRPADTQFPAYHWDCQSVDDSRNRNCRFNISSAAAFSIPANTLKRGCQYMFRLRVYRDHNPRIQSHKFQLVAITARSVLQVAIECLRNCRMDFYTPNSQVHLKAVCLNCGRQNLVYQWSVDGQKMFISRQVILHIRTDTDRTHVQLVITAEDGRYGRDLKTLVKNPGPTPGECSVTPPEGHEAVTSFVPCCRKFLSQNQPIEYWFYAGSVLLGSCLDCSCELHLPATDLLRVLACDAFSACHSSWIKVKVAPLHRVPTQPRALWEYITSSPNNIQKLLEEGPLSRYLQTVNAIASRLSLADSGATLLQGFEDIHPHTRSSLGKLANLTLTLAHRLPSSNPTTHALLTLLVKKMNDNLGEIATNDNVKALMKRPFKNITLACLEVFRVMEKVVEQAPLPPPSIYDRYHRAFSRGSLDQHLVDKLFAEMPGARTLQGNWLNSTWEMERLSRFLRFNRDKPSSKVKLGPPKVSLQVQCLKHMPNDPLSVNTTDTLHTVELSPDLFKEILESPSRDICFRLTSVIRKMNWWYPDEKRPSTRLLSVRIFEKNKDHFTVEIPLQWSQLNFKANMTNRTMSQRVGGSKEISLIDKLAEGNWTGSGAQDNISFVGRYTNVLQSGKLRSLQEVRLYRILVDEQTVLAVHFTRSTHKLQALLKLEIRPLWSEISDSFCFIPANTTHKTILMRNNCHKPKRVYLALRVWSELPIRMSSDAPLPGGPAEYSFAFQFRSCASWIYSLPRDKQRWSQDGCFPGMDTDLSKGLHCTCHNLGTYTNYLYYTPAIMVPASSFENVRLNVWICVFYAIVLLLLLAWILWLIYRRNALPSRTVFIQESSDDESDDEEKLHDLVVQVRTGGHVNAQTTASITLVLFTTLQEKRRMKIKQDPERNFMKQNTTFNLWLRTRQIRVPTEMMVYHDNAGRYPSWFVRRIEISDIQTRETQVFVVKKWLKEDIIYLKASRIFQTGQVRQLESWCIRLKLHFEMLCINFGLWQPITGNWRETNHFPSLSRAKRCCVLIIKLAVGFTVCVCYFGETTIESIQLSRTRFLSLRDLQSLTLLIFIVEIALQILFKLLAVNMN